MLANGCLVERSRKDPQVGAAAVKVEVERLAANVYWGKKKSGAIFRIGRDETTSLVGQVEGVVVGDDDPGVNGWMLKAVLAEDLAHGGHAIGPGEGIWVRSTLDLERTLAERPAVDGPGGIRDGHGEGRQKSDEYNCHVE